MPNKNPNPNGGSMQGARDQLHNIGEQVQQGAAQVGGRLREGYDSAREGAMYGYRQAEGMVARNPAPSVLLGFGVGFGLGLVLCSMLTREETWAEKYLPESLQDVPDRYHHLVSSLKSLPRHVHQHLPSSISRHLG
jgi:hypothetical protein